MHKTKEKRSLICRIAIHKISQAIERVKGDQFCIKLPQNTTLYTSTSMAQSSSGVHVTVLDLCSDSDIDEVDLQTTTKTNCSRNDEHEARQAKRRCHDRQDWLESLKHEVDDEPSKTRTKSDALAARPAKRRNPLISVHEKDVMDGDASFPHHGLETSVNTGTKIEGRRKGVEFFWDRGITEQRVKEIVEPFVFLSSDGGDNCIVTDGLMALLREVPNVLTCAGLGQKTQRTSQPPVSCRAFSTLRHIQQKDKWTCGFRNLQMLLTAVLPLLPIHHSFYSWGDAASVNDAKTTGPESGMCVEIPSLIQLQQRMEESWRQGFDAKGAEHYRYKIIGKKSWIGAVEVVNLLSFMGIDSTVLQFVKCRESRQLLFPCCTAYFASRNRGMDCHSNRCCNDGRASHRSSFEHAHDLLTACTRLAEEATTDCSIPTASICTCPCLPLYLQWEGHSVTVVGVEEASPSTFLLVLDPIKTSTTLSRALEKRNTKPLRLNRKTLEKKDCQLVVTSLRSLSAQSDRERLKQQVQSVTAAADAIYRADSRNSTRPQDSPSQPQYKGPLPELY
jgi:hypothetical protein